MKSIVFLLGAGISLADGKPSVGSITRELVEATDVPIGSDSVYEFDPGYPRQLFRKTADDELKLVAHARALAEESLLRAGSARDANYEEIAAVIGALADHLRGERENAIAEPWVERLCATFPTTRRELASTADGARNLITDLVVYLLRELTPPGLKQFDTVIDACRELDEVCVTTLNHDRLAEQAFDVAKIERADGFGEEDERGVASWDDEFPATTPRLLKLHGSVDWWRMPHPGKTVGMTPSRVAVGAQLPWGADVRPVVLTGTHHKEFEYSRAVLLDQQFRFAESLRQSGRLVAIGYGFGDKAINSRIIDWMSRTTANRLTIVGPHLDELHTRVRGAIARQLPEWRRQHRVGEVHARAEDTNWAGVRSAAGF